MGVIETFFHTAAIVLGIISPFLFWRLLHMATNTLSILKDAMAIKREKNRIWQITEDPEKRRWIIRLYRTKGKFDGEFFVSYNQYKR